MSKLIVWSEAMSVGEPYLDRQHQRLLEIINELFQLALERGDRQAMRPLLTSLLDYTQSHLADEERILRESGYPKYAEHVRSHNTMRKEALRLRQRYGKAGCDLPVETLHFLKTWWREHILGEDRKYAPHLAQK